MAFCKNCGSEVDSNLDICPHCGAIIPTKNNRTGFSNNSTIKEDKDETFWDIYSSKRYIRNKNLVVLSILTLLTCGLFAILYWQPSMTDDINTLTGKRKINGIKCLLLNIFTFGIYHYIWHYNMGSRIEEVKRDGKDRSFIFIISAIFGWWWINDLIIQHAINQKSGGNRD